jgi:hypothetical protein
LGSVTPCCFRHATSFARRAAKPPLEDEADVPELAVVVVVELLELLLPHATSAQLAANIPNPSTARLETMLMVFTWIPFLYLVSAAGPAQSAGGSFAPAAPEQGADGGACAARGPAGA